MLDVHVVSAHPQRHGPICIHCGLKTSVARITPHPDDELRALLCSYECTCCGHKVSRKEY
jgi:hypothetical protein